MTLLYLTACFFGGLEDIEPEPEPEPDLPELELGHVDKPASRMPLPGTNTGPAEPDPAVTDQMCDDVTDGGPIGGPDCITADIECGDTIVGHTIGGSNRFDSRLYEAKFCTPRTTDHDGGDERVYRLKMPAGEWTATVWLDTPCANLDLAALMVTADDTCPDIKGNVPRCEMWPKPRGKREKVELASQKPTTWLLVVEGQDEEEGPFALHVACEKGLM
jgi:hypothetical protein